MEIPSKDPLDFMAIGKMMMSLKLNSTSMLPGQMSNQNIPSPAMMKEFFTAILTGKNFDWYISDFDNLMMGNKHS